MSASHTPRRAAAALYARQREAERVRLIPEACVAAWAAGQSLPPERAVVEALADA